MASLVVGSISSPPHPQSLQIRVSSPISRLTLRNLRFPQILHLLFSLSRFMSPTFNISNIAGFSRVISDSDLSLMVPDIGSPVCALDSLFPGETSIVFVSLIKVCSCPLSPTSSIPKIRRMCIVWVDMVLFDSAFSHLVLIASVSFDASIVPSGGLLIAYVRDLTAVCRSHYVFAVTVVALMLITLLLWQNGKKSLVICIFPVNLVCCGFHCHDISFIEFIFFLNPSLVLSDVVIGSKSTLFQGATTHRCISSALVTEALARKAALIAASSPEIRDIYVSSDSHPLVKLLNFDGVIKEWKSYLFDICCLMSSFSFSIRFMYVFLMANEPVVTLAKSVLRALVGSV